MNRDDSGLRADLGDIARTRRKALGMSQEDVAYKLKIEQTDLSKIERGAKRPSPQLARQLAAALQLPANAFVLPDLSPINPDDPLS
jgi:transcriptional regulator with XRE-family HTH domain